MALAWFVANTPSTLTASTVWNGPSIGFYHTQENNLQDHITADVAITRGSVGGLYNALQETGATDGVSPAGTEWAIGTFASHATFGPCLLEQFGSPSQYIGTTFVVHLTSQDILLELTLTNWGGVGGIGDKTFGYTRSTSAPVVPSVTITNPASGTILATPATVSIGASASISSGTVTNVQFFTNNVLLASDSTSPFGVSASLPAGNYSLTAVAAAGGIKATSAVVNISIVTPVAITLSGQKIQSGQFSFNYTANPGLSYFVERSSDAKTWVPLSTNVAAGSSVPFSESASPTGASFYRVGRLPNP